MKRILNSVLLLLMSCLLIQCDSFDSSSTHKQKDTLRNFRYVIFYPNGMTDTVPFKAVKYTLISSKGTNSIYIDDSVNSMTSRIFESTAVLKVLQK